VASRIAAPGIGRHSGKETPTAIEFHRARFCGIRRRLSRQGSVGALSEEKFDRDQSKVVGHSRYVDRQGAQAATPGNPFADVVRQIPERRPPLATSTVSCGRSWRFGCNL
jgi:hypothetical protein